MAETVASIVAAHRAGTTRPEETIARTYRRIREHDDPAVFIYLRQETEALAEIKRLGGSATADLPLYGIPIAVKDNIDVAGMPTTAACEAYAYAALEDATAVARLRRAGAIVIGKTNLDQFATGLVGVRTPYGIPRNAINAKLIPGGSSCGSAVAVAAGFVPIALGTDTAGSGRVPAALNNIVGLKPSLGLVPTTGVVPACRTLDCVSIFALTVDDAVATLAEIAGEDAADPFSRLRTFGPVTSFPQGVRVGIPNFGQRIFFGNQAYATAYDASLERIAALGASLVEIDIEALFETGRLLYDGPWVAERFLTIRDLIASAPDSLHPVTREIILQGARPSAADAFAAFYRLAEMRRTCEQLFHTVDAIMLPTIPTAYTVDQVLANPIELNSRLGLYTNFVNLLDLCGLAIPAAITHGDIPFGITLLGPAGRDAMLASIGRVLHAGAALPLGALRISQPDLAPTMPHCDDHIALAVFGAHLSGMPLNDELKALHATLVEETQTAPDYRLFGLTGARPAKPGLLRVAAGTGAAITLEIWSLPAEAFGRFVAAVPAPLTIGTVKLADGRCVKGFLVEPEAITGTEDISRFGGWRSYVAAQSTLVA